MTAAVRFDLADGGAVRVTAPAGWADSSEREALRAALDAVRPTLARLAAPPLPPRPWPPSWEEYLAERVAVVAEGSPLADAEAVALADLRVAVHRGEVADG